MYCHKCGTKNDITDTFCQQCGEKLFHESSKEANQIASSTTKKLGEEIATAGVKIGKKAVKKGHSTAFKIGIITSIGVVILAFVNFYFSYMIDSPDDVVKNFMDASDSMNYNAMIECFDPTTQNLASASGDLIMSFIGGVTGFSIDFDTAATISSAFGNEMVTEEQKCHATNFKVESIEGEKLSAFVEQFGTKISSIGNLLGSKAIVSFEVDNKPSCIASNGSVAATTGDIPNNAKKIKYQIEVRNYGSVGWKIPGEMKFEYIGIVE